MSSTTRSLALLLPACLLIHSAGRADHHDPASAGTKRALLIGIDRYQRVTNLGGCANDVDLMADVLISRFDVSEENLLVLKDAQATRSAILGAIRTHLIAKSGPGDLAILHFSGHGSRMKDASGDEGDHWDETIVPHDSRTPGVFDINDDEINGLMRELAAKTPHATFILDSCHSGSAARAGATVRQVEDDPRDPPPPEPFALGERGSREGASDFRLPGANYVLISGCRATELSNEGDFEGQRHGAMTWFLSQALQRADGGTSYRRLMEGVTAEVTVRYPSQHPQLEGTGQDSVVLGDERIPAGSSFGVRVAPDGTVSVDAGRATGLFTGSRLAVHPADTRDFRGSAIARIELTDAAAFAAKARVVEGTLTTPGEASGAPYRALLEDATFGEYSLPIWIHGDAPAAIQDSLRSQLKALRGVLVATSEADATLRVHAHPTGFTLESADVEEISQTLGTIEETTEAVRQWARWLSILHIQNSGSPPLVDFSLRRAGTAVGSPMPRTVTTDSDDETTDSDLVWRVENKSPKPVFVALIDLSTDRSVTALYPDGPQEELAAGAHIEDTIGIRVPEGRDVVVDHFKLFVTSSPIRPELFEMAGLPPGARATASSLEKFLLAEAHHGSRGALPRRQDRWGTASRVVRIERARNRAPRFAAHLSEASDPQSVREALDTGTRAVCDIGQEAETCLSTRALDAAQTVMEVRAPGSQRGIASTESVGTAFEDAYRLRTDLRAAGLPAERVEPLFEVWQEPPVDPGGIGTRSGGDANDPRAEGDDLWSHKMVRAAAAFALVREAMPGAEEGAEAKGILVAHPDTGYREHPEIWSSDSATRPVLDAAGRNYVEVGQSAMDPLLPQGHPGHGTASGSVIVSPKGCQLDPHPAGCVNGTGRGARLIPLRVDPSVVLRSQGNLSEALFDIADGDLGEDAQLVSIAMGGPPSWSLWKAVRAVEAKGIVIVAAAGNYVRVVVWPARFDSVVAVAAVGVGCEPWLHSSRGRAVDLSAPGESVWRATLGASGTPANGMGKGTTFATGTTAGVVALWLARHLGSPELASLRANGAVTTVLQELIAATAWTPDAPPEEVACDTDRWSDEFGAGILDAAGLLEQPLPAPGSRVAPTRALALEDLPLFTSLYEPGIAPERVQSDYSRLLTGVEGNAETVGFLEAEVVHHYALDEEVQAAFDAVVEGAAPASDDALATLREALLRQNLSPTLRAQLEAAAPGP